jgi:hypothetical protein
MADTRLSQPVAVAETISGAVGWPRLRSGDAGDEEGGWYQQQP